MMEPVNEPFGNTAKLAEIANAAANERAKPNYQPFRDNALAYVDYLFSEIRRLQSIQQERDRFTEREQSLMLGWYWLVKRQNPNYKVSDEENALIDKMLGVGEERT